jgi:prefoldin subunit 5
MQKDIMALVQWVLREAYVENLEVLRSYAEKVKFYNKKKKEMRKYLSNLRNFKQELLRQVREKGVDTCRPKKRDRKIIGGIIKENRRKYKRTGIGRELCIPNRIPPKGVSGIEEMAATIQYWEEQLSTAGDDAQLANVDLQNWIQKVQQSLTTVSNVSKSAHDTAMSVIRNMK